MSWSIQLIGTPQGLINELNAQSEKMNPGISKEEFDEALPHIRGLLAQNYAPIAPLVRLEASGSGWGAGDQAHRNLSVKVEPLYGKFTG